MKRKAVIRICAAALAVAGLSWCIKAGTIIVTGYQPPLTLELGQLLSPVGIIGIYLTFDRPHRLEKTGLALAILSLVGSLLGLLYQLLPGAQISTGKEFIFPNSLFVLIGSAGGFVALVFLGIAFFRARPDLGYWCSIPLIVALLPLPLAVTGIIHFEMPIFLIGIAWMALAYFLARIASWKVKNASNPAAG